MDCSPPGSSVHGILQARVLEWVAFPSPDPGIESKSTTLQADSLPTVHCTMQFYIGHGHLWVLLYKVEASGTNLQWILRDDCTMTVSKSESSQLPTSISLNDANFKYIPDSKENSQCFYQKPEIEKTIRA